ncbi:MAG TPA: DUF3857 domain-containing protein [Verrucomicrobiae bacterium]|nr:DUF3857 domain-containing protein [Verrucomicrobiae bacterium]
MKRKFLFIQLFLLAFALLATPLFASDTNFTGTMWNFADEQKVLAAAAEITPEKYPNSDSAIVEQKSVRDYHADGTGECQDETFTKVLTEKGRRESREASFFFMLPYWTVDVPKLEVIKPDGSIVPVDVAANSKESIDDSQMAENIYDPNMRILRVNIPQLEVGDIVHVVSRMMIQRSIMPDEYDEENVFEGSSYIRHIIYEVHAPTNLPLQRIRLRDEIAGTIASSVKTNDDSIVYDWEVNNVPRMFDEPGMPPADEVLQRLFVSTLPSWRDVSKWYWNLSKPHLEKTTPEMKQTVADLTKNAATDLDKIKAIFYYVSKNIRYMGLTPEKNRPGFEPHDVCITFDKKYGVCRDKAGLLVEMLRLAGFDAYPVLINIGAKRDQEVPAPNFNHAIVCVELKPGQYTLMDPTDENTRELLPTYDCDRSYLVCKPAGETLLISPVESPDKNMMRVTTSGTLNANGVLSATSDFSFEGVNDDAYRNAFVHLKPDQQRQFIEGRLKDAIPGAKLISFNITPKNILDTSLPLHVQISFVASGMTANGGTKSVVNLPWVSKDLGVANRVLIGSTGLAKRKYPLQTDVTCGVREDVSLKLTGGFAAPLAVPDYSSVNEPGIAYVVHVAFTNDSLKCSRELKLKTDEFSAEQYLKLKQTLKGMALDGRKNLILALKSNVPANGPAKNTSPAPKPESNAEILYSKKSLQAKDAHTAVYDVKYSKRILTYDGKIREAEVKIPFNPACQEAKIVSAVVISKTGERQEISSGEINVMDQGWNAGAKRYTGGKILVANLPGVEIGSTIEVEFQIKIHDMPSLSDFEPFQFPDALDKKSFSLTAPADLKIQKLVSGNGVVSEKHKTANGEQTFEWNAKDVKALPSEPQLPPAWIYDGGVDYFIGDAHDYWKSVSDAMLAHSKHSSKAAELAKQLTKGKSKLDAVKAIRDFIAQNIRPAGPSFTELPLRELSDADTTLTDGYGHAADRAILFHAMLSAAGFQPEFVMASGLPPVSEIRKVANSLPLPDDFQTPLVKISVDGDDYYLNDTDQYAHLGTTGSDGKLGVELPSQKMETIHAAKNCSNKTETDYAILLSPDGRARIKISSHFYGEAYNMDHKFFAELPPEERNRYFQGAVSRVAEGAKAVGDLTTKFDTYPGLEEFTVELSDYGIAEGRYFYFNLPFSPSLFDVVSQHRSLPLFISDANEQIVRTKVQLPSGYQLTEIAPGSKTLKAPGGSKARIVETNADGQCKVTDEFEIVPAIIAPKNYPSLLDIQSTLGEKAMTTFLLERK